MSKQIMVRDYPKEELPRERFIRYGPESLSNTDLLAILIRTGTKNESVLQLAERVITEFGGLRALKEATLEELTKINGIGQTKAVQILAAIELGRRIMSLAYTDRYVIRTPQDGADYVM